MAIKMTPQEEVEELKRQIALLQSQLDDAKAVNAEQAQRAAYFTSSNTEVRTGRTVKVPRCKNPWVKEDAKQVWEDVEVPTYYFKVDMPPVGGIQILLNGEAIQHGQTYEVTPDRLATLKEIVYRLQAHDAAIHGNDEDTYRPRVSKEINVRTGAVHSLPPNWLPGMPAR